VTDPKPTPPPGAGGGRVVTPASPPVVRGVPSSGPVPVAPPATVAALGGEVMPNEVIVTVAPNAPATAEEDMARRYNVEIVERTTLPLVGLRAMRCRWSAQRPVQSVIGRMQSDPRTIDVQANYIYRPSQTASTAAAPNDLQYALAKLGLGDAQVLSAGHGTRIAIIDSGIDSKHPELLGALVETFDALGGEAEPGTHGTAIAGIIAARGTLRGIAPGATLMAVRAFPSDRSKQPQMTTSFVLLKALEWSITNGARVLNLSLSGPRDPLMEKAVSMAAAKGVIIVAAAGNNGDKAPPAYPAAYKDVIAVTAIDARDQIYTRANRGRYIAVAAPGVDVLSLVRGKGHDLQTGTSFAAAHVSGIVALMIERNPALTVGAARKALMESAIDLGEPGTDEAFGAGRTSAAAALKLVTP
jgi:subtilisin family serine protease